MAVHDVSTRVGMVHDYFFGALPRELTVTDKNDEVELLFTSTIDGSSSRMLDGVQPFRSCGPSLPLCWKSLFRTLDFFSSSCDLL